MIGHLRLGPGRRPGALDNSNSCSYTEAPRQQARAAMPGREARSSPTVLHQRTPEEHGQEGNPISWAAAKSHPCRCLKCRGSLKAARKGKQWRRA